MKKILLALVLCLGILPLNSFSSNEPMQKVAHYCAFENFTINYDAPCFYDQDYWCPGQAAGYYFVLDLTGYHAATWELAVYIEVMNQSNDTYWKKFTFIVEPCYMTYHTHIMEMQNQLSYGEHFSDDPQVIVDHFWIIS